MKKGLLIIALLLLVAQVGYAQIEVFYLPDSGFLRVTGEVVMEPTTTTLSFLVFPTAQITEFWADDLIDYSMQRGAHGTMVTFALSQARRQTLSFSYEGFLEPRSTEATLGPNQVWFPELSFPIQTPTITIQLPPIWEFKAENILEISEQDSFQLVKWQAGHNRYPTFQVTNTTIAVGEEVESLEEIAFEEINFAVDEMIARIQIQVTRLTRAISQRNSTDLEKLTSPQLQKEGLAQYLASLPLYYGRVTSELVEIPTKANDEFNVVFFTEQDPNYLATMTWQERDGWLELETFRLVPYEGEIPQEVLASVESFLREIQSALKFEDHSSLESLIAPQMAQDKQDVLDFLANLGTEQPWVLEHLSLDPFTAVVHVPDLKKDQFVLDFRLIPGQYHWLIQNLGVFSLR